MAIKYYKNIKKLKKIWNELYDEKSSSPTLDYDFVIHWNRTLKQKKNNFFKGKLRYLAFIKDENIYAILPVLKKKTCCCSVYLLDYFDILYSNKMNKSEISKCIIKDLNNNQISLHLSGVNENSNLYKLMKNKIAIKGETKCSAIKLESDNTFDSFFKNLSKSVRQNIRTAYNRLQTDNKSIEYRDENKGTVKKTIRHYNKLYVVRRLKRYKNMSILKSICYYFNEPILSSILKSNHFKLVSIIIDGQIAGYMAGLLQNKVFYVPRLVINDKFAKYSAGMLLICEFIKHAKGVDYLDLSSGSESYKKMLQAIEHKNYDITIE